MLEYDPSRRINMAEALQHPFMQNLPADKKLSSKPREVSFKFNISLILIREGVNRHQINAQSIRFASLNFQLSVLTLTNAFWHTSALICNLSTIFAYMCILTSCHIFSLFTTLCFLYANIMVLT